jgi:rhamnose utilization protein RhaD (predicted bifunctional aldolase and dehydrogenase)
MISVLDQLVAMSRELGTPERDYVILAEGNTSARAENGTFWIKASGFSLNQIGQEGFVEVSAKAVLALLGHNNDEQDISKALLATRVDTTAKTRPSIEATMHAVIYELTGANFIGHTHPTAVNAVLCAQDYQEVLTGRLFPDHIVFCGAAPMIVPYVEPGVPLARKVSRGLEAYLHMNGRPPKTIFLQNHGLIALAQTAAEVESITAMTVKSCRVLLGAAGLGGLHFLTQDDIERIDTHPSEHFRRRQAGF